MAVSFHWGKEYSEKPSKLQIKLAHHAVDSGADLIVGHHPHVLQGIEFYKGNPVIYSLGNFIFDQKFGNTVKGIAVKFIYNEKKSYKVVCMPITRNYDSFYPQIASERDKNKIKQSILDISLPLNKNPGILNNLYFE